MPAEAEPLDHRAHMAHAITLAHSSPMFPFGAVIVHRDTAEVLAEGRNTAGVNPVMHAEIDAICNLSKVRPGGFWSDVVLYTTAEPCPMCQSAIAWSGIPTVHYGTSIKWLQANGWRQIDIHAEEVARRTPFHGVALHGGVAEEDCNALFEKAAVLRDKMLSERAATLSERN